MSYVIAEVVLGGVTLGALTLAARRRRKDRADMAWSKQFSDDMRAAL